MEKLTLRQKSLLNLARRVISMRGTIKQWFYHAGMKFLQSRELTDEQEKFLEEVTDFFVENLEGIEKDKKFFERVELGPIQITKKKKKVSIN